MKIAIVRKSFDVNLGDVIFTVNPSINEYEYTASYDCIQGTSNWIQVNLKKGYPLGSIPVVAIKIKVPKDCIEIFEVKETDV